MSQKGAAMQSLPINLRLQGEPVLLIGGGGVALRKARLLCAAGARLTVVSPQIEAELTELVQASAGHWHEALYPCDVDLQDYRLVIAATNDPAINAKVFGDCENLGVLVNSVDDPPHCRFTLPALIDRSPMQVAISTDGASPVLARQWRTRIETLLPMRLGELVRWSGHWRAQAKQAIAEPEQRRLFWEALYASPLAEQILSHPVDPAGTEAAFQQFLQDWQQPQGEVYLVGAGPGDPELLTLKALRLMQQADVVVYDRLVSAPILELVRRDAERIYVGKARADHALPQEDINQLLVRLAREGKRVCRLKGGDPFIFGRGGEELEQIAAAGIPFTVVPGITAASGCAAYAGIPLTHRDHAQSVRLLTGHLKAGSPSLPWAELIHERQTLVLYMGLVGFAEISAQLIAHGLRADMPAAVVSKGTTPEQVVITGTVGSLPAQIRHQAISAPTLIIIGTVVSLRDQLQRH